jgi:hypothetical protein
MHFAIQASNYLQSSHSRDLTYENDIGSEVLALFRDLNIEMKTMMRRLKGGRYFINHFHFQEKSLINITVSGGRVPAGFRHLANLICLLPL